VITFLSGFSFQISAFLAMPVTPHIEEHFTATETVRDIVIGMSDGLTVPFALAAGLTGAIAASGLIITAGLAEIAAGSIAMGLGGYLAAKTDAEHYRTELAREIEETHTLPDREREEVADVFRCYGMSEEQITPLVETIASDRDRWVDFMMKFELGLEAPHPRRALISALTISASYAVGGLIPLAPYMFVAEARDALVYSMIVTLLALTIFGYIKGRFTGTKPLRGALQTVLTGGLAAAAAFLIAKLIQ
jgi:vacuolar iron transporter family protein